MSTRPRIIKRPKIKRLPNDGRPVETYTGQGGYRGPFPKVQVEGIDIPVNMRKSQHEPTEYTRALVVRMAAVGVPIINMQKILNIGEEVLRKNYTEEIETGADRSNILVANKLFHTAVTGRGKEAGDAQRFWLSRRSAAFKEVRHNVNEHSGPEGGPIETVNTNLTDEERAIRLYQLFAQKGEDDAAG